jgi:hypothetical protein
MNSDSVGVNHSHESDKFIGEHYKIVHGRDPRAAQITVWSESEADGGAGREATHAGKRCDRDGWSLAIFQLTTNHSHQVWVRVSIEA